MNWLRAPLVAVMLGATACGGYASTSSTATPSTISSAGNWSGSVNDAISGTGTMQLSLSELASSSTYSLTGTWTATFKDGESFSGPAVGELITPGGYAITLYVATPLAPCLNETGPGGSAPINFILINVVSTTNGLTATVGRFSCSGGPAFGTISLSKQ